MEEDAYNTKVITLSRSGSLPEVIETSHDYAKVMDKEQLIDRQAVATVISNVGEGAFYDGVLRIVRTEDGSAWTGVPVSAWIGGIWYRKDVLAKAGLEEPKNWQQLLDVAQKLNDPANKKYGIALPTAESVLTEQSFSQFALSNQANVFNAEGKITLDTPEMMQALTYYRNLAANTMPGSNDIMEVKDAFMNGTAPMAIYSTYILPAVIKEGDPKNVGFVVPTEKKFCGLRHVDLADHYRRAKGRRDGSSRKICHLYGAGGQHCRLGDDVARRGAAGEQSGGDYRHLERQRRY